MLFHWAAPGYLMLFPLLGQAVARGQGISARWLTRRGLTATAGFVVLALAVVSTQVRLDWLGPAIAAATRRDPDLDGIDWTSLRVDTGGARAADSAGPGRRRRQLARRGKNRLRTRSRR